MMLKSVFMVLAAFIVGIFFTLAVVSIVPGTNTNRPSMTTTYAVSEEKTVDDGSTFITRILGGEPKELPSPYDRIGEENIKVERDRVTINIANAEWSKFTDTNSMDPVIDEGANAIQIVPKIPGDIHIGDIISYKSEYADGIIIHRVIGIGNDEKGWFCTVKGDNNDREDPGRIRFDQIKRVVVAIIY
jgi:hypothetical protein